MYKLSIYFLFILIILLTNCNDNGSNPSNNVVIDSVIIGSQIWMTKNLDVDHYRNGDSIPQVTDSTEWGNLTTGAWCYYENTVIYGVTYGKLYNWFAVNDPRGLAPTGWHVPSDSEWIVMINYLGGDSASFGKLKEVGTGHWSKPNIYATNESEFTALPGGLRDCNTGLFWNIEFYGYWWTNTEYNYNVAYRRSLGFDTLHINENNQKLKAYGFSVRCVKD